MENETINLTSLICDTLNSIFFKIFSSIDHTISSNLDSILFIQPTIVQDSKFQKFFGTDPHNGLLLIANSLIFGIVLFYVFRFVLSHLTYSKVDSLYQFSFKCILFIVFMNCSLWICEGFVYLTSLLSNLVCEIGHFITGKDIGFSSLLYQINSALYPSLETFDIFSLDGILKLGCNISIVFILFSYAIRYIMCKILILLAPFAFLSLITNHLDGFFKGWLKEFLILLLMQIFVSIVLVVGFTLEFYAGDLLSKSIYFAILVIIAKCHYNVRALLAHAYEYSHYKLKDFI